MKHIPALLVLTFVVGVAPQSKAQENPTTASCHARIATLGDMTTEQVRALPKNKLQSISAFLDKCVMKFGGKFDPTECAIVGSVKEDELAVLGSNESQSLPECGTGFQPRAQKVAGFECGEEMRPGVPYNKLAECYDMERKIVKSLNVLLQAVSKQNEDLRAGVQKAAFSVILDGQIYSDVAALVKKYNELISGYVNEYNSLAHAYTLLDTSCDKLATACDKVSDRLSESTVLLQHATGALPAYPTYTPSKTWYCSTVYNTTTCHE